MNGRRKLIVGGVVAGGLMLGAAGLVIGAGVAKAAPGEDTAGFVRALRADGFKHVKASEVIPLGRDVCAMLRYGDREEDVVELLTSYPDPQPWGAAVAFVADAHIYLCHDVLMTGVNAV